MPVKKYTFISNNKPSRAPPAAPPVRTQRDNVVNNNSSSSATEQRRIRAPKVESEPKPITSAPNRSKRELNKKDFAKSRDEYKKIMLEKVKDLEIYRDAFSEDNEGNAIFISECNLLLKSINSKCNKIYLVWKEDGLYFIIISNNNSEKNVIFFPKDKVMNYSFKGSPRYYYITINQLMNVNSSNDNILIINEDPSNLTEESIGIGLEVLHFRTYSFKTNTTMHNVFNVMKDQTTNGVLEENDSNFPELELLNIVNNKYKWDVIANTDENPDFSKNLLKNNIKKCEIVYYPTDNTFNFNIFYAMGGTLSSKFVNECNKLEVDTPFSFNIQYSEKNILKSIKNRLSQKLYITLNLPGFIKNEIIDSESVVCNVSHITSLQTAADRNITTQDTATVEKKWRTRKQVKDIIKE